MADVPKDLTGVLQDISGGEFHAVATARLAALAATMQSVERNAGGKPKGKLTINLTLKLDRGVFEIDADIKVVEPATITGRTFMYANQDGGLVKEDPRQGSLALAAPVRDGTPDVRPLRRDVKSAQAGERNS